MSSEQRSAEATRPATLEGSRDAFKALEASVVKQAGEDRTDKATDGLLSCIMCNGDVACFCAKCAGEMHNVSPPTYVSDDGWNDHTAANLERIRQRPSDATHTCGTAWAVSTGPGRVVGAIARSLEGVMTTLPDDFDFQYCPKCNQRNMTPELEQRFLAVEQAAQDAKRVSADAPAKPCRACSECEGDHHWLPFETLARQCKHCDLLAEVCDACEDGSVHVLGTGGDDEDEEEREQACEVCDGHGVIVPACCEEHGEGAAWHSENCPTRAEEAFLDDVRWLVSSTEACFVKGALVATEGGEGWRDDAREAAERVRAHLAERGVKVEETPAQIDGRRRERDRDPTEEATVTDLGVLRTLNGALQKTMFAQRAELALLRKVAEAAREKHREYTEVLLGDGHRDRALGGALADFDAWKEKKL